MRTDALTLHRQASPLLSVRAWHNRGPESWDGSAQHTTIEIAWSDGQHVPEYAVGSQKMTLMPGQTLVIPAHTEHYSRLSPGGRARVLGLDATMIDEVADAMNVHGQLLPSVSATRPRLPMLGQLIFEEAVEQTAGHELALDALAEALAVELVRAKPAEPTRERSPGDPRIRRALAYIDASYAGPLSIEAIAKVAGMSRFYFGRLFEAQVGKSPYRYLVDLRVTRAAALIRGGRVSVTEAALSVGYNDLGRFGRAFRARFGLAPSEALAASRPRSSVRGLDAVAKRRTKEGPAAARAARSA